MPGGGLAARVRVNYNYRGLHFFLMQWLPLGRLQGMGARLGDAAMHAPSPAPPDGFGNYLDTNLRRGEAQRLVYIQLVVRVDVVVVVLGARFAVLLLLLLFEFSVLPCIL